MKSSYLKILVLTVAAAVVFTTALPCAAAEEKKEAEKKNASIWDDDEAKWKPTHPPRMLTEERIERMMSRLAKTNPEEAERLGQLRKTDPEKFKAELREIRREHFGRKRARPGYKGYGGRYHEGEFGKRPGGPKRRHGRLESADEYLEWLGKNYPDKAARLDKLKEKNPELYDRQLRAGMHKYRRIMRAEKENPELAKILKEDLELKQKRDKLLIVISTAKTEDEKKVMIGSLEQVLSKRFDLIVRRKQIRYERLLKKLERLKERAKENEAEVEKWKDPAFKSTNVKARVEELVGKTEKFSWE